MWPTKEQSEKIQQNDPSIMAILEREKHETAIKADIHFIKEFRSKIKSICNEINDHTWGSPYSLEFLSIERAVYEKLTEARMWLGEALGELAEKYPELLPPPYPNGNNTNSPYIDPKAEEIR